MRHAALIILLLLAAVPFAGAVPHSSYSGFAQPLQSYSLSSRDLPFVSDTETRPLSVSVSDHAVYRYAYVSLDGKAWVPVALSGSALGGLWLNGSVTAQVPLASGNFSLSQSRLSSGRNFMVVYSCSRGGDAWDCHSGWQIWQFNASMQAHDPCGGVDCDDADQCTIDSCSGGQCSHQGVGCTDSDSCCTSVCSHANDNDCVAPLPSGLVSWWKLDGNAQDSAGTNHGTNNGATPATSGCISGSCYDFDGSNDYIRMPDADSLQMETENFTFAAWIYPESYAEGSWGGIVGGEGSAASLGLQSNGRLALTKVSDSDAPVSTFVPDLNAWNFVAVAYDSSSATNNLVYYMNGNSQTLSWNRDFADGAASYDIGARSSGTTDNFNGRIDEVMIWNRKLNATEIDSVYDSSGYAGQELYCGDGSCGNGETCESCAEDCGSCAGDAESIDVLFYQDFEDDALGYYQRSDLDEDFPDNFIDYRWEACQIVNDYTDGSPTKFIRLNYPAGEYGIPTVTGANIRMFLGQFEDHPGLPGFNPATYGREMYIAYDIKFSPGFEWKLEGKFNALMGGRWWFADDPANGVNWFYSGSVWKSEGSPAFYLYYPDEPYPDGSTAFQWGNPDNSWLPLTKVEYAYNNDGVPFLMEDHNKEETHSLTFRVVMNTVNPDGTGNYDGIVEGFFDGVLISQIKNVQFRTTEDLYINLLSFGSHMGGLDPEYAPSQDQYLEMDNLILYKFKPGVPGVPYGNVLSQPARTVPVVRNLNG